MRGVLIGTDIVKDTDGLYKALETNTSIGLSIDFNRYFDSGSFLTFLGNNGIDNIHFIFNRNNTAGIGDDAYYSELEPTTSDSFLNIPAYLREFCSGSGLEYSESGLEKGSITIPVIEDAPNKLILRLSYDTTALIDDTYARDNWEFLKLMYDTNPNSIPKTYINDTELGFDSIGSTLRNNGNQPNYCIKKRITPADTNVYPKFVKISTLEELENVKSGLEVDEYLQEYVYNTDDLFDDKLKHYRSVDLLYGPNLDTYNFFIQEVSNTLPIIETPDYDDNNEIQIWDRLRYTNKWDYDTKKIAIKFSADAGTKILKPNNDIVFVDNLNLGDYVKSVQLATLPDWLETDGNGLGLWTASVSEIITNSYVTSSIVDSKNEMPYFGQIIEITLENGSVFSDVPHAKILKKETIDGNDIVFFAQYDWCNENDYLVIWDNDTDSLILEKIVNVTWSFQKLNAYILDIEEVDVFLTLEETGNRYGLLTHNYDYDCRIFSCPFSGIQFFVRGGNIKIVDCGSGGTLANCTNVSACVRCATGHPTYFSCATNNALCQFNNRGCRLSSSVLWTPGSYCNNQKSDKRLKKNIKYIETIEDIKVYEFEFTDEALKIENEYCGRDITGKWRGTIAQKLEGTKWEHAVIEDPLGWLLIDYSKLPIELQKIN